MRARQGDGFADVCAGLVQGVSFGDAAGECGDVGGVAAFVGGFRGRSQRSEVRGSA